MSTPFALLDRLVERASDAMDGRISRRGFIARTTMVGTAIATTGCTVITSPGSPYTRVTDCPPRSLCRDGYTEFCCVINQGMNTCPPGTATAGWWRADYSVYCNGTRYYIDCNDFSGGPPPCRCGNGCDTRKVYCNRFRYGQCNQWISGTGVIACRMVTCVPPYELDLGCTTSSAVDNATAGHYTDCAPYVPPAPPPPPPSSPPSVEVPLGAALVAGSGTFGIFVRNSGQGVSSWIHDGTVWSAPEDLGGATTSRVVAAADGDDVVLVARGAANDFLTNSRMAGAWSGWSSLGGAFSSDPAVVADGSGAFTVVGRRTSDRGYLVNRFASGSWSGWVSIGGTLTSDPTAFRASNGDIWVVARGTDRAYWVQRRVGATWSGWVSIGGIFNSNSDGIAESSGPVSVFGRGVDDQYYVNRFSGGAWSGWVSLGGTLTSDPVAVVDASNVVSVFGRGTDNTCWVQRRTGGSWSGWIPIGGTLTSDPAAVVDGAGSVSVFGRSPANTLVTNQWSGGAWSGWVDLGGSLDPVRGATVA